MKKIFTFLIAVLLMATVWAQSPEKMSYQAVIRNSSDALVTNTQIGMRISILQGSASGMAVYVETQIPTTNANGLVSIEIGAGTVESGDFTTIDWANGLYFIKTETDPAGGTSYSITGTSQLLSVPYALHAKTAETVTGSITETDPTYSSSQAVNITAGDITNLGNLSGINTGDQDLSTLATKTALGDSIIQVRSEIPTAADGSETKLTAGTNVTITGSGTTASPYVVNTAAVNKIAFFAGNKVGDILIPSSATTDVVFEAGTRYLNDGSAYDTLTGKFVAPVDGIYQFNVYILYTGTTGSEFQIALRDNGGHLCRTIGTVLAGVNRSGHTTMSATINLLAGTSIWVTAFSNNPLTIDQYSSGFSGHLVYEK